MPTKNNNRRHRRRGTPRSKSKAAKNVTEASPAPTAITPTAISPTAITLIDPSMVHPASIIPVQSELSQGKQDFNKLFEKEIVPLLAKSNKNATNIKQSIDAALLNASIRMLKIVYREGFDIIKSLTEKQLNEIDEAVLITKIVSTIQNETEEE